MAIKARGNVTVTFNSVNLSPYITDYTLTQGGERIDVTTLTSTAAATIAGDSSFGLEINGTADIAVDNVLGPERITPGTPRTLVVTQDMGAQTVTLTWTSNAEVESYNTKGTASGLQTFDASFALSGAPTRSVA